MSPTRFDLIIIGSGSAAQSVSKPCAEAGWKVAVVDSHPLGGTCALRGCDPKKVLVAAAAAVDRARKLEGKGVDPGGLRLDWAALMAFKRGFTGPVPQRTVEMFRKQGIAAYQGRARFVEREAVEVNGELLSAPRFVIAAGARPRPLDFPGAELVQYSSDFLELDALPPRPLFVGGGFISFEFAHIAARAGARPMILERGPRPLKGFDAELVRQLVQASEAAGIDVQLDAHVAEVRQAGEGFTVHTTAGAVLAADTVFHGAGRVPDIDDMNLDAAGVQWGTRGIPVNDKMQSVSNPAVYAAGDCVDGPGLALTPVARAEGKAVARDLLHGDGVRPDYRAQPSAVFTLPPLARVGLTEDEARRQGIDYTVRHGDMSQWATQQRLGETHAGYKLLVGKNDERLLGVHLLGPHAAEVINLFALAIRQGLAVDALHELWAYPTSASDLYYMV